MAAVERPEGGSPPGVRDRSRRGGVRRSRPDGPSDPRYEVTSAPGGRPPVDPLVLGAAGDTVALRGVVTPTADPLAAFCDGPVDVTAPTDAVVIPKVTGVQTIDDGLVVPVMPADEVVARGRTAEVAPLAVPSVSEAEAVAEPTPVIAYRPRRLRRRNRVRKVSRVVRRIDAWSVFKVAVVFFAMSYVVFVIAAVLLWNLASTTGTVANLEGFLRELFGLETFELDGPQLFRATWMLGAVLAVAGVGACVTAAVLFNLISDLVGGVRVTVLEEEVVLRERPVTVSTRRSRAASTAEVPASPAVAAAPEPHLEAVALVDDGGPTPGNVDDLPPGAGL